MEALKRNRAAPPLGPLFAVAEEGAEFETDTLDKVAVLFPLPLPEPFDYRAASSLGLQPGMHVIAPIGSRLVRGVVWSVKPNHPGAANLKAIEEVLARRRRVPEIQPRLSSIGRARYVVRPPRRSRAHGGAFTQKRFSRRQHTLCSRPLASCRRSSLKRGVA